MVFRTQIDAENDADCAMAATQFTVPGLGRARLVTRYDDVSGGSVAQNKTV